MTGADVTLTGRIALGGAGFSLPAQRDDDAAIRVIRTAYDAGIRIFDSARAYAPVGDPLHNERLFRRALAGRDEGRPLAGRRERLPGRQPRRPAAR